MHEHRMYPGAGLAPTLQYYSEYGDVADGRDHHEYAVRDYGDHVTLVEPHIVRQIGLVEQGRVRHVVHHARPRLDGRLTGHYTLGDRLQYRVRVGVHHFHDSIVGGGSGGGSDRIAPCAGGHYAHKNTYDSQQIRTPRLSPRQSPLPRS